MKAIAMDAVRPGMTLAQPVASARGSILVPAGTVLTEALVERLQHLSLATVHVKEEVLAATTATPEAILRRRFRRVGTDPLQQQIFTAVLQHLKTQQP